MIENGSEALMFHNRGNRASIRMDSYLNWITLISLNFIFQYCKHDACRIHTEEHVFLCQDNKNKIKKK